VAAFSAVVVWLRGSGRVAVAAATAGLAMGVARGCAPSAGLAGMAQALGGAAGGARVEPADLRWEPSGGILADATSGRRVLFLARADGDDTRDVWRAIVRVAPEGGAIEVLGAYDLTNTPLGDDHALVVRGDHAAYATQSYGQEQSVTALDLAGEGSQNKTEKLADRAMAALTNLQLTGSTDGVGRVDVTLETPATAVGLALDDHALELTLAFGDLQASPRHRNASLDLATGELSPTDDKLEGAGGLHAQASVHLPKRFSHWAVDTLRAVPWIGPEPVAWIEDQALSLRDDARRFAFKAQSGDATDVVASVEPPPPVLDTSQASVEEAHWPPARIASIWQEPAAGEGEWTAPDVPWMRRVPGVAADAPAPFQRTFVRPDQERPYAKVILLAMDLRQLDLDMEGGVEDPEPLTGAHGNGRIPRDPAVYKRVAAAFNGAFKTEHGHYGMMVRKRVLLPPVPGSATVIVLDDGRVGFGTWGADRKVGGVVGVPDESIVSFRQNLDALVDRGQVNPTGRNLWGYTLPGKGVQTERSGLCVTSSGHLLYAWGDDVSATMLAKAMKMGGCDYAMHLDMNPFHTGFLFTAIDDPANKKYRTQLLDPGMQIPADRYVTYAPKDFFYVTVHDPAPPAVDGGEPWRADGGAQPPPRWMPGVWIAAADGPQGTVDLVDVEPGRATWRIRAGTKESPGTAPLRDLADDDAKRVLLAATMGIATEKRPRGLATDGRMVVPAHGGGESAMVVAGSDGKLAIVRAGDVASVDTHVDAAELDVLVWDGKAVGSSAGLASPRAALGITPAGRVILARGTFASVAPLAEALVRAGCTRAVVLDRGTHAGAQLDRAGTASPPLARYEETVLYAIAAPLKPRGFRFDAATLYAQAKSR
jgi:hypothetical protein